VDYKTDEPNGNLQELTLHYGKQVGQYQRVWERITRRPTSAFLLYLSPEGVQTVEI
jgi:ATP-dependent exoDNAse (exonuclease V) beta subunit